MKGERRKKDSKIGRTRVAVYGKDDKKLQREGEKKGEETSTNDLKKQEPFSKKGGKACVTVFGSSKVGDKKVARGAF